MTTKKQALSQRPTANNRAAQTASADRRQCPVCLRRSALVSFSDDLMFGVHCRWCHYERATMRDSLRASVGEDPE